MWYRPLEGFWQTEAGVEAKDAFHMDFCDPPAGLCHSEGP